MYLKKFLHQPNVVGSVLIALLICSGAVFAIGFDGFNVQAVAENSYSDGIETLLRLSGSGCCSDYSGCGCLGGDSSASNTCTCTHSLDPGETCSDVKNCPNDNSNCSRPTADCISKSDGNCNVWCATGNGSAPCSGKCPN